MATKINPDEIACSGNMRRCEKGNALLIILIGIVLFAALMFTMSRSMNESGGKISSRQARIAVSDIMDYSQTLERTVARIMRRGCSENDVSFRNNASSDYDHVSAAPEKCRVFDPSGGKVSFRTTMEGVNEVIFTGANSLDGIGTTCADSTCTDLLVIFDVGSEVCSQFNEALGNGSTTEEPGSLSVSKFTGEFTNADEITSFSGKSSACVSDSDLGGYYAYVVLYPR